jgi:RNA polymerase sigma-70 factor (ECF subfamily)
LHKVEGIPYQEISEIMNMSVSAIESLIHRAKTNLKKILKDYYLNNK